jgi:predicted nucleotidyltransferase
MHDESDIDFLVQFSLKLEIFFGEKVDLDPSSRLRTRI